MKVLFFLEVYASKSETFIINQIEKLSELHDCYLICNQIGFDPKITNLEIKKIDYNYPVISKIHSILRKCNITYTKYSPGFAAQLEIEIQRINPDIIHCYFGVQAITLIDNLRIVNVPIFITFLGYDASLYPNLHPTYARKLKSLFNRSDIHPIMICDFFIEHLRSKFNIESSNYLRINLGIDSELFKPSLKQVKSFTFIQVSRFTPKKGLFDTIEAFKLFSVNHKGNLLLVGDGPEKDQLIRVISNSNIKQRISVKNWTNNQTINNLLNSSMIFVHPSKKSNLGDMEGTPVAIMEAMSVGLPVISTYHSGIPELLANSSGKILVKEGDIKGIMNAMIEALNYKSNNNRKIIKSDYELNKVVEKIDEAYQSKV